MGRRQHITWLTVVVLALIFGSGCTQPEAVLPTPMPADTDATTEPSTPTQPAEEAGEATDTPIAEPSSTPADSATPPPMSLGAEEAKIEHSPRMESFQEPASVGDITPPDEDTWVLVPTRTVVEFRSYDSVRITEDGLALLNLGDFMQLLLKRDTVLQPIATDLVEEQLATIGVDVEGPVLQQLVLAMHLLRGGFIGEKAAGGQSFALTTPNAVILVSGTTFFAAYDPDTETTWAGNFDGEVSLIDSDTGEDDPVADRQLMTIPPVNGQDAWPLHDHLTREEFESLIDYFGSPIGAADILSGPYLISNSEPAVSVRAGPGTRYPITGQLPAGGYARITGTAEGWWRIECPTGARDAGGGCWISGEPFTSSYNTQEVPTVTDYLPPPTFTPTSTPIPPTPTSTPTPPTPTFTPSPGSTPITPTPTASYIAPPSPTITPSPYPPPPPPVTTSSAVLPGSPGVISLLALLGWLGFGAVLAALFQFPEIRQAIREKLE